VRWGCDKLILTAYHSGSLFMSPCQFKLVTASLHSDPKAGGSKFFRNVDTKLYGGFLVLTVVTIKSTIFWDGMICSPP
jgi:hypothetical protein